MWHLRLALILLGFVVYHAPAAQAQMARVTGGEHEDFTRLVIEAEGSRDWRLGRTEDGYALALGPGITAFDLSQAFRRIPRTRITALWQDPDSGQLRLSMACACHAIGFEFRPGITVIDIRNGPPPEASVFETPLNSPPAVKPAARPAGKALAYDWLALEQERKAHPGKNLPIPLPGEVISLDPLRDALLTQISRGASDAVVEVIEVLPDPNGGSAQIEEAPWSRISVGEMPGLRAGGGRDEAPPLNATGENCLPDSALDLASWGVQGPVVAQLGPARATLITELDHPDPNGILQASRLYLWLGFGAEARQFLQLLSQPQGFEAKLLSDMTHIVDLEPLPDSIFSGQESCATAAALWAVLAMIGQPLPRYTNGDAVARSFAALPPHLRRHLGPPLADAFLAADQVDSARIIRDAILRLPNDPGPEVDLLEARFKLANGQAGEAGDAAAKVLLEAGGASAEAAITLVEASFRGTRQIDPNVPPLLESFLNEAQGTARYPALLRALILAKGMSADFDSAFALAETSPQTLVDLWALAGTESSDEVFLVEASKTAAHPPNTSKETRRQVAGRLFDLGFDDLGLQWLGPVDAASDPEIRLTAARAHLRLRDAAVAIRLLKDLTTPEAAELMAEAVLQLGDAEAASKALIAAGAVESGQRALTWTQDWKLISAEGPDTWRAAATFLAPLEPPPSGPIARGTALVKDSAATREAIENLLLSTATPAPG